MEADVESRTGKKGKALDFVLRLAAGRVDECPFQEKFKEQMLHFVIDKLGAKVEDARIAAGQSFRLRLFSLLLKQFGDPDWELPESMAEGVPLGVGVELPRTPAVYEEQVKWSLEEDYDGAIHEVSNYESVRGHESEVLRLFQEEEQEGWMRRRLRNTAAGCSWQGWELWRRRTRSGWCTMAHMESK